MKIYKHPVTGRHHPHEQYFKTGGYCPSPNTKLDHFRINKLKYEKGSAWKCENCEFVIKWEDEFTGQKVSRIVEKIEEHIKNFSTHGHCDHIKKAKVRVARPKQLPKKRKG